MDLNRKPLPKEITIPENSFGDKKMYERIYWVISQDENYKRLQKLGDNDIELDELFEETEYQQLIDAGLAVRNTGAGDPYIRITALGKAFLDNTPIEGLKRLTQDS
jgi:hypothetical protein